MSEDEFRRQMDKELIEVLKVISAMKNSLLTIEKNFAVGGKIALIEQKLDNLTSFKWKVIGFSGGISFVIGTIWHLLGLKK